ncbi:MAG: hypothetical protein MUF30_03245 [Burkholderiales bacterium]|jgi:hypothetical protein|nr:hypothetical protein [Burkholderiales bacterium]
MYADILKPALAIVAAAAAFALTAPTQADSRSAARSQAASQPDAKVASNAAQAPARN